MINFFQKLNQGLKKTSSKISSGISDIFTKQRVDSETLEDLQDILISSDMGIKASDKIIENFKKLNIICIKLV